MLPLSSLLHFYGFQAAGGRPGRAMFGTRWMAILFGILRHAAGRLVSRTKS
jgi:hypothetical protein